MLLYVRRFSSSFRGLTEVVADKGLFCALDTYRGQAWRKTLQEERRIGHANTVEGSGSARRSRHPRRAPTSYAPRCASANIPTAALARTGSLPTTSQVVHGTPSLAGRAASDARPAVGLRIPLARSHNPRCHNQRSAATRTGQLDALATICERTPCAGADSLLGYSSAEGSGTRCRTRHSGKLQGPRVSVRSEAALLFDIVGYDRKGCVGGVLDVA
jgi:hypothetical protein